MGAEGSRSVFYLDSSTASITFDWGSRMNLTLDVGMSLANEYLAKRGLKWADVNRVEAPLQIFAPNDMRYEKYNFSHALSKGRFALFLPYMRPDGQSWLNEEQAPYGVLRFLGKPMFVSKDGEEPPKIAGPYGRKSEIHFAPLADGSSWETMLSGAIVLHCESAIKAECMARATGLACVGYSGVNGYSSNQIGIELIHAFAGFNFADKTNVILYDSDVVNNEKVALARMKLAHKMRHVLVCADVRLATLPQQVDAETGELSNWGPDDFWVAKGTLELMKVIDKAERFVDEEHSTLVKQMNARVRWVNQLHTVYSRDMRVLMTVRDAQNQYANVKEEMPGKANAAGAPGKKQVVFGFPTWMQSVNRESVDKPGYEYLGGEFFEEDGLVCANTFRDGGADRCGYIPDESGGIRPILIQDLGIVDEMLTRLFKDEDRELLRSYLRFGRYTGWKPTSYCIMHSNLRGVGKGWFTELARALFGSHNVGSSTADMLAEKYNAHTVGIRLLIAHEFKATSSQNKAAALNYLKSYVGDETIPVRAMHQNVYNTKVKSLVVITTNDKSDVPSDGLGDRRQWYIEAGAGKGGAELVSMGEAWWDRAWEALKNEDLMSRVAQWVYEADEVDFRSWRPKLTEERTEDLMAGMSGLVQVAYDVRKKAIELGIRATTSAAIKEMMTKEMDGQQVMVAGKTFTKYLKDAGWFVDLKRFKTNDKMSIWFPLESSTAKLHECDAKHWISEDAAKWLKY